MKASLSDFIFSTLALSLIIILSVAICAPLSLMMTRPLLGAYFPIADLLFLLFVFGVLCALAGRLVLRLFPLGSGAIAMTDPRFTTWKLYTVLYEFGRGALLPFTVVFLRPVVQKLLGTRIGKDVALAGKLVDPHLIRIEDCAIIGEGSVITAHAITSGSLYLAPVIIGARATVGVGAVIYPGVSLGADAIIAANAVVRTGTQIAAGEVWGGVPARRLREAGEMQASQP